MDFRELQYLISIAKFQSLTKASEELYVSQPTLSRFVQNLERNLGQPVFRRIGSRFLLTYTGERCVMRAKEMLAIKHDLDKELEDIVRNDIGELKIGFPITRGYYILPSTLSIFKRQFPKVKVTVQEQNSSILQDMILNGDIDMGFFSLPISRKNIDYELIRSEEIILIMSPDHPLVKMGQKRPDCVHPWIDIKELKDEFFIFQRDYQRTRKITDQLFKNAGFMPNDYIEIDSILVSVQLACSGFGLSFVAETHLHHIDTKVRPACFSVGNPNTITSFVAAFRYKSYLPHYTRQYLNIVKNWESR